MLVKILYCIGARGRPGHGEAEKEGWENLSFLESQFFQKNEVRWVDGWPLLNGTIAEGSLKENQDNESLAIYCDLASERFQQVKRNTVIL